MTESDWDEEVAIVPTYEAPSMSMVVKPGAKFIIWAHDQTPEIDCARCQQPLISDDNGNAPLVFSLGDLLNASASHECETVDD